MIRKQWQYSPGSRALFVALGVTALAAIGSPGTAAATTAGSTILNVAKVTYTDVANSGSWSANAATTVTVNLVGAAPTLYAAPGGAGAPGVAGCPATGVNYPSGSTISYLYALASNANGADTYSLAMADNGLTANTTNITRTVTPLSYNGTPGAIVTSKVLKSAIPVGIADASTLQFPGGSLLAQGFAANDIVLVEIGPVGSKVKQPFLVASVSTAAANAPATNRAIVGPYTDLVAPHAETLDTLTLTKYTNVTMFGQSVGGGGVNPAFTTAATAPTLGVPVGEMVLLKVDVSASTTVQSGSTAQVGFTLSSSDTALPIGTGSQLCTIDHFLAPTLSILKRTRNVTASGSFGPTATGNPGDILEYEVTVSNTGANAVQSGSVKVSDAIPSYTSLVAFSSGGYGGTISTVPAPTDKFANLTDSAGNTLDLDVQSSAATETQPTSIKTGYGDASLGTAAGLPLSFYLGDTSTNATGGKVPSCSDGISNNKTACLAATATWIDSYKILYRVKID